MMYCRRCGAEIPVDSVFCPSCGTNLIVGRQSDSGDRPEVEKKPRRKGIKMSATLKMRYQMATRSVTNIGQRVWGRLRLFAPQQVLVGMGFLFGVVGFFWGLLGHQRALDWLLFGLMLVLGGIYFKPSVPPDNESHQKEMTD